MDQELVQYLDERFNGLIHGLDQRFDRIEQRLDGHDGRFEQIDRRFEQIDRRFEGIDRRFDEVDRKFDGIDRRFEGIDRKFDDVKGQLQEVNDQLEERIDEVKRHNGVLVEGLRHELHLVAENLTMHIQVQHMQEREYHDRQHQETRAFLRVFYDDFRQRDDQLRQRVEYLERNRPS